MMHLKEFQRDGKLFLSVMDKEGDKPQSGSLFRVHRSLRRPKANQAPAIEPLSFPPSFPFERRKVPGMTGSGTSCRACNTTSPAYSPSFLYLVVASYPGNSDGARTCFFIESLATFPCTRNGQSMCSLTLRHA